jgi:hypothetical protein
MPASSPLPGADVIRVDPDRPPAARWPGRARPATGLGDAVELRSLDIDAVDDHDAYDFIRLPSAIVSPPAMHAGLPRLLSALKRGGWIILNAPGHDGNDLSNAIAAWRVAREGGDPRGPDELVRHLAEIGYGDPHRVRPEITPPLAIVAARRPECE